jgi:hypothetical protein
MERSLPLACSDIPVLREVGGSVPHYFNPNDPHAAADAIASALATGHDRENADAQLAHFSWRETALGTYEGYQRALTARGADELPGEW